MACPKASRARSSSIIFQGGPGLSPVIKLAVSSPKSPQIVLRNLGQARLLRQVSRSNSPPRAQPSEKLRSRLREAQSRRRPRDFQGQVLRIEIAENRWREMKRELPTTPETVQPWARTEANLRSYLRLCTRPVLKVSTSAMQKSPVASKATLKGSTSASQKANFVLPARLSPQRHGDENSPINGRRMGRAHKTDKLTELARELNRCLAVGRRDQKKGKKRKNDVSMPLADTRDDIMDASTEENSKVNLDYLCIRKISLKPSSCPYSRVSEVNKPARVAQSMKNSAHKEEMECPAVDSSEEDIKICCPKETKQAKLIVRQQAVRHRRYTSNVANQECFGVKKATGVVRGPGDMRRSLCDRNGPGC